MNVTLRQMTERDLAPATALFREAFRTLLNVTDRALGDGDFVNPRFRLNPEGSMVAESQGQLLGTNFVSRWGSVAVLGPVVVRPRGWTGGAGKLLHEAAVKQADAWGCTLMGGFTFAHTPNHLDFFVRTAMWPRLLTMVFGLPVRPGKLPWKDGWLRSSVAEAEVIAGAKEIAQAVYPGLDLGEELAGARRFGLGDGLLVRRDGVPVAFALCHMGAQTQAGSGALYVKFGAARPGDEPAFEELLEAIKALAAEHGCNRVLAGVNSGRRRAWLLTTGKGYLATQVGVALHRGDPIGYSHEHALVIDDWR